MGVAGHLSGLFFLLHYFLDEQDDPERALTTTRLFNGTLSRKAPARYLLLGVHNSLPYRLSLHHVRPVA